jgi:hypothetical protein
MDPLESDPEFARFARAVKNDLVPKLNASEITVSLCPTDPTALDVKYAVELGFSILLDKPIILCVAPGQVIPDHLVRVADRIVEYDRADPAGSQDRLQAAIEEIP